MYFNIASTSSNATATKHIFTPGGELLATVVGTGTSTATTTYLHLDHLGGTNVATDGNQEVVQTLDYFPYGSQRIATGSFSEQRRFIGEEFDSDTEFSYLNARYYQGSRGQFMSQDPVFVNFGVDKRTATALADPQLQNAYAYSRNNPVAFTDPSGEFLIVPLILTLAMINQLYYLRDTYQMVQTLNNPLATPDQKSAARNSFYFDLGLNTVTTLILPSVPGAIAPSGELALEGSELLLTGMDDLYGNETYGELDKRAREERTRPQARVTVMGPSNGNGSGSGGSTYAYQAPSQNPVGSGRSSGGSFIGLSGSQQSALQSFTSAMNAQTFEAKSFVNSLQAIIKAFDLK
jgi:RHS repeat-associated protein